MSGEGQEGGVAKAGGNPFGVIAVFPILIKVMVSQVQMYVKPIELNVLGCRLCAVFGMSIITQ